MTYFFYWAYKRKVSPRLASSARSYRSLSQTMTWRLTSPNHLPKSDCVQHAHISPIGFCLLCFKVTYSPWFPPALCELTLLCVGSGPSLAWEVRSSDTFFIWCWPDVDLAENWRAGQLVCHIDSPAPQSIHQASGTTRRVSAGPASGDTGPTLTRRVVPARRRYHTSTHPRQHSSLRSIPVTDRCDSWKDWSQRHTIRIQKRFICF